MREVLRNFQSGCELQGPDRSRLLQKVTAASIAYAAPCFTGSISDWHGYYRNTVLPIAYKVISEVNERVVINTDAVLADVEKIWQARYFYLNSPRGHKGLIEFHATLAEGVDITALYDYWSEHFCRAVAECARKCEDMS